MFTKLLYSVFSFINFGIFVLFSYLVHKGLFKQFDFDVTIKLQDHISRRFDEAFSFLSLIGSFEVISVILILFLLSRLNWKGVYILFLYVGIHVLELYGKTFMKHPGPPFFMLRYDIPFLFPTSYVQPGSSYPSGHSARAIFLTSFIILLIVGGRLLKSRYTKVITISSLVIFDILMLLSRVYLGEHWTTDVIGGSLLGLSLSLLGLVFY